MSSCPRWQVSRLFSQYIDMEWKQIKRTNFAQFLFLENPGCYKCTTKNVKNKSCLSIIKNSLLLGF